MYVNARRKSNQICVQPEGTIPLGKPRLNRRIILKLILKKGGVRVLTQGMVQWCALVKTVVGLRISHVLTS